MILRWQFPPELPAIFCIPGKVAANLSPGKSADRLQFPGQVPKLPNSKMFAAVPRPFRVAVG